MQRLSQQQRLLQKLSPQQIQLMKLLQVPTALLDERIKEEIEENPALEESNIDDEITLGEKTNDELQTEFEKQETDEDYINEDDYTNIDISEYVKEGDDEIADYSYQESGYFSDDEDKPIIQARLEDSFHEHLINQLGMTNLTEDQIILAEFIIGSLDDDGYLRRDIDSIVDDLSFRLNVQTNVTELQKVIRVVQNFEPTGIGATSLQECLIIQLKKKNSSPLLDIAIKMLEKYFDEFSKKHYDQIQRSLNITDDMLKEIIGMIVKLNPKPGAMFQHFNKAETYIMPDFFVFNNNGILELQLNNKNAPELKVSSNFRNMLVDFDKSEKKNKEQKEALFFIKQKIDSAKWFIDAIKQRQDTLMSSMSCIMRQQENFFLTGDESVLKPMILKDISDRTGFDISTISRVVNSKFVQTEFGTFKLRYFFSDGMTNDSGEEVSTREVKKLLSDFINGEDKHKPLSDERLTEMLSESGFTIARRTTAKYREQLNIPVARLRKEL
jgi:RNA polymerase sigma-54 factor